MTRAWYAVERFLGLERLDRWLYQRERAKDAEVLALWMSVRDLAPYGGFVSVTDFPRSAARASEGICPLCDRVLVHTGDCMACGVLWGVETVEGRLLLRHSRPLKPEEIKRLHDRGDDR